MISRSESEDRTNREIIFSRVHELHNFLLKPTFGLEKEEMKSLKKLIESCSALIDIDSV